MTKSESTETFLINSNGSIFIKGCCFHSKQITVVISKRRNNFNPIHGLYGLVAPRSLSISLGTLSTHNVNGFTRSKKFLHSLCVNYPNSIRAIQEHWLRPPYKKQSGVNQLRLVHDEFDGYGTSAMTKSSTENISTGRPHGGTGFLYNRKYSKCLKPLSNYIHDRVTVLELTTENEKILLINAYMPFYNTRDLTSYLALYRDTIGHIESVISHHPSHSYVILADFNCNLFDHSHPYTILLRDFMRTHHLFSCYDLIDGFDAKNHYTRCDLKTNSFTLIDGILLSNNLRDRVQNVRISAYGDNVSDHIPVEIDLHVSILETKVIQRHESPFINWSKLSQEQKTTFRTQMTENLLEIPVPSHIFHGDSCCSDENHIFHIEQYYNDIVSAVSNAEMVLPKCNASFQRSFWDDELSCLKQNSLECCSNWKSFGSPKSGPIFDCWKRCSLTYKSAIRKKKRADDQKKNDNLYMNLLSKDGVSFWKTWRSVNSSGVSLPSRIDGMTDDDGIASAFANYFESVYGGSTTDKHTALKREFDEKFAVYHETHKNGSLLPHYLTWEDMLLISQKIKLGKATTGAIKPEHFLFGCPTLLRHFQILFNGLIQHGYVPMDFLKGTVTPIVKDNQGDLSSTSNYRGITLSCLPAKLFEAAIQMKTTHLLKTDPLQFGFKAKTSTSHAIHAMDKVVNHFLDNGSNVYVAFLDCTKAFDRISHFGLFTKLMERKLPLCFLLCLIYWYLNMSCVVKWGSSTSRSFVVPLGVKQGGMNSPDFFSCYINDLIIQLRNLKRGCHIDGNFLASILFADDLCLIAPTRESLQKMIDLCSAFCSTNVLSFNPRKSKVIVFSKKKISVSDFQPLKLESNDIEYVSSIKYLGTSIFSEKGLQFSAENDLRSFYRASNSILNTLNKPSEEIQMQLLYTNCVPILSYASAVKVFKSSDFHDCNTALNNAIRKIFSFNRWESVRSLRESFKYPSLTEIFARSRDKFLSRLANHSNPIISWLASL